MAVRKGRAVREKVQGYGACLACKTKRLQLLIPQIFGAKWERELRREWESKEKTSKGKSNLS